MSEIDTELREQWFGKAGNDLRAAEMLLAGEDPPLDVVCFHCQQAAEKYLKGLLAGAGLPFPPVHDLGRLLTRLDSEGFPAESLRDLAEALNPYAVEVRYPEAFYLPGEPEAEGAVSAARRIRDWVLGQVPAEGENAA
jgi:HEPN domain-containing protein